MVFVSWSTSLCDVSVFSALVALGHAKYAFTKPCYALYIEDIDDITDESIPSGKALKAKLTSGTGCGLFHYTKKDSVMTWTEIPWKDVADTTDPSAFFGELNLATHSIRETAATMSDGLALTEFRSNKSFTVITKVKFENETAAVSDDSNSVLITIGSAAEVQHTPQFCFAVKGKRKPNILVYKAGKEAKYLSLVDQTTPSYVTGPGYAMQVAFVQDTSAMTWTAYFRDLISSGIKYKQQLAIPTDFTWQDADHPLQLLGFRAPTTKLIKTQNWRGYMTSLKCYPSALTEDDVYK